MWPKRLKQSVFHPYQPERDLLEEFENWPLATIGAEQNECRIIFKSLEFTRRCISG